MRDVTVIMMSGHSKRDNRETDGFPPVDMVISNGRINIWADLPGIPTENLNVYIKGDYIVIEGSIPPTQINSLRYLRMERRHTPFYRACRIPSISDIEKIQTKFENGVLHISWALENSGE